MHCIHQNNLEKGMVPVHDRGTVLRTSPNGEPHMTTNLTRCFRLPWLTPALSLILGGWTLAQEPAKPAATSNDPNRPLTGTTTNTPAKVKFRPPSTGAPSVRLTGGSRGSGDSAITLDVLAPDDTGLTTQEQPSLFWYQSKPADAKFELTLLQENKVKPLVQVTIERSVKAGIQRLKLADHGARLVPGVEYQWVVALITDPDNRSTDLVASGVIKRVEPADELKDRVRQATPSSLPGVYAEAGYWYDALAALSDQIETHPNDTGLKSIRADLLQQVGLKSASSL
jgi:hypothetical protein